jgi:O-antigen/teichoic acid export membrane protein
MAGRATADRPSGQSSFAASASLSVIAWFASALAGFVCVPIVVHGLKADAYGLLALITVFTGYLGLMEMGLGQAIIRYIAYHQELGHGATVIAITKRAIAWFTAVGGVGGIALFLLSPWLVKDVLHVPVELQATGVTAFRLSAFNFFLMMLISVPSALLPAFLRFDLASLMTGVVGAVASIGPAILVTLGYGLVEVVLFSIALNVVALGGYTFFVRRLYQRLDFCVGPSWKEMRRPVLKFAGLTAATQAHLAMAQQTNKAVVGIAGSTAAAGYYQVPSVLISNVGAMLQRIGQVIFPHGSQLFARGDHDGVRRLYMSTSRLLFLLNATITTGMIVFARPLIEYWVSPEFADKGSIALIILSVSSMINCTKYSASNFNWSAAKPGINLGFSLVASLVNLALIYPLTAKWGIPGAAAAGLAGNIEVPFFLWFTHRRVLEVSTLAVLRRCYLPTAVGTAVGGVAAYFLLVPLAHSLVGTLALWVATVIIGMVLSGLMGAVSRNDLATGLRLISSATTRLRNAGRAREART